MCTEHPNTTDYMKVTKDPVFTLRRDIIMTDHIGSTQVLQVLQWWSDWWLWLLSMGTDITFFFMCIKNTFLLFVHRQGQWIIGQWRGSSTNGSPEGSDWTQQTEGAVAETGSVGQSALHTRWVRTQSSLLGSLLLSRSHTISDQTYLIFLCAACSRSSPPQSLSPSPQPPQKKQQPKTIKKQTNQKQQKTVCIQKLVAIHLDLSGDHNGLSDWFNC